VPRGGSVQFLNNRLLYLSDQGIMAFDGQESVPLTDQQIPATSGWPIRAT